jgi:hypothetical protein
MAFHKSNYGSFGGSLPCDVHGFVPEARDGPWDLDFDHGSQRTHEDDGSLTEYGEWWKEEGFPELKERAVNATEVAEKELRKWQEGGRT